MSTRRADYRIIGCHFTPAGKLIEKTELKYLTGVTLTEAHQAATEVRRARETQNYRVHMAQVCDDL